MNLSDCSSDLVNPHRLLDLSNMPSKVTPLNSGGAMSILACSRSQPSRPAISIVPPSTKHKPAGFAGWMTAYSRATAPRVSDDDWLLKIHHVDESIQIIDDAYELISVVRFVSVAVAALI